MKSLAHIDTWIFDMDNTLYDASTGALDKISYRMTYYIADLLKISFEEANVLRRNYWNKYGNTLYGLMTEHGSDPCGFLEYAQDIDLSDVKPCSVIRESIELLQGKKIIFTNAPRSYTARMTKHLGIDRCFDNVFTIEDADYLPKPYLEPYFTIVEKFRFDSHQACMFEDTEINLKPAADLGMTTVWITGKNREPKEHSPVYVHHKTEKLADWLQSMVNTKPFRSLY